MGRKRVLVVDDAAVVRRLVTDALSADPDLEVCGAAADGRVAIDMVRRERPDLVVLDLEMPEMGGLEALKAIRAGDAKLPVIIYSEHTDRGGRLALDALALGATDVVTKPGTIAGLEAGARAIRGELLPRIKALCTSPGWSKGKSRGTTLRITRPRILALAASTGGPNALRDFFAGLPGGFPSPIVIVQHMPALFTKLFAERLSATGPIAVREAEPGMPLEHGRALIAPGGFHLVLKRDGERVVCDTNQAPPVNSCRPSADVTFASVAEIFGAATVAVVLTGIGQDGLEGCRAIHGAGGHVLAQDEASSVVWGMPGAVASEGFAEAVLPPGELARDVSARFGPVRSTRPSSRYRRR